MPTVPRYQRQVETAALPAPQFTANATPANFGSGIAQGLGAVADVLAEKLQMERQTAAKTVDIDFTQAADDALNHPETGYLGKQGREAVDGYQPTIDSIKKMRDRALGSIKDPEVKRLATPVLEFRANHAIQSINRHAQQENRNFQFQTSNTRALVTIRDAASDYGNEERFIQALNAAKGEAAVQGKLRGWDDATTQFQAAKYQDDAFKMRYEAWRLQDPVGAFANFQQNAGHISPIVRQQLGSELFHAAAPVLATQINAAGGAGLVSAPPEEGGSPLPRGIRNNNPGNIARGSDAWQGEVPGNDPRYVTFASPEAGIRAMGKTLLTYQDKHGLNTVQDIISRWAPATENNTAAYVATVAGEMGVKPDAALNLRDTATLTKLTRAMIRVENGPGAGRITDEQLALGLASATGDTPLPTTPNPVTATAYKNPSVPTGNPLVDGLPADWKLHVLQLARSQAHQAMTEARETLRTRVQDAQSAYLNHGFAPNAPNEAEFIRAYGQSEGAVRYREFQDVATLGQQLQQVKTLPAAALDELLKNAQPAPGDGFSAQQRNYEILTKAIGHVQEARTRDPVGYAIAAGSYGIKPIQRLDDPRALSAELSRRAAAAPQMAADYGTPPQLLTKEESRVLAGTIKAAPVETQKRILATMYQGIGKLDLFKATMQAIAPDTPTVAVAGIYQARGLRTNQAQDVADLILRGQAILTPNSKEDGKEHQGGRSLIKMPEDKLLLSEWNSETGDAFRGKEQAADLFMQTARAIYAARSAEEGDYSGVINSKRWRSAINLATGGIERHNGAKVVVPYGMGYDQFQDVLKSQVERIAKDGGAFNATAAEMMRLPLENVGDGRYLFRRGTGYLVGKDERPVVADLNGGRR